MITLITILTFGLLAAFQFEQKGTILDFATTKLEDFKAVQTYKTGYFVNSIENHQFHNKKIETALKAKKSHSNKNSYNRTVYTQIQMWQFDFQPNEKCRQAIDSLLICFPFDCAKISKQVDQGVKVTPSIWIFDDKTIYIAQTNCEHVDKKWTKFKKDFAQSFADTDTDIIVTECGKLTWTTKEKLKNAP